MIKFALDNCQRSITKGRPTSLCDECSGMSSLCRVHARASNGIPARQHWQKVIRGASQARRHLLAATHRVKSLTRYHRDMHTYSVTSDVKNKEAASKASICTGFAPSALPEVLVPVKAENSHTGVSTWNVHVASKPRVQKEVDVYSQVCLTHHL